MSKAAVLIDGPDLYNQERAVGCRFAYHGITQWASECAFDVKSVVYYSRSYDRGGYVSIRRLLDYLQAHEVPVVESAQALHTHLTADALMSAFRGVESVIVVSSSATLAPLGAALRELKSRLIVLSVPRLLSTELRLAADESLDLEKTGLLEKFERARRGEAR